MTVSAADATMLADELLERLRPLGTTRRAEGERQYLKSSLTHVGVTMPQIRRTVRAFVDDHPQLTVADHVALTGPLWSRGIYELRQVAVQLLERPAVALDVEVLGTVQRLVHDAHTWALVDPLAVKVIGEIARHDARVWDRLNAWAIDDDMWVRRSALLAHLPTLRVDRRVFPQFAGYADSMLAEREFFIRKAIGWVLREVGKRDPQPVTAWLEPRTARVSGVTIREAVKYLPEADRDRLLTAYRERR
ncbi:DNA alkylation repair protein [soil metagenome]